MREIIVGTAGHIDHGKTALVEALTGINTDRLKEEKIRGITIELGFAHMNLPSGLQVGIVDVPGHERFVKTMVAGATGIDLVMLVVAADEGVMPQTREHLDICRLLRVKRGLVVLTKVDLVDEDWLQLVTEDIREFLQGTFMEDAPLVRASKVTGEGLQEIIQLLDQLCQEIEERRPARFFRLPIDRVFVMRGFGTVVTGTLLAGRMNEGDGVEVAPRGIRSKIRGLQIHNRPVKAAVGGMRTAVNLQGVERDEVARGDVLIPPDSFSPTHMIDVHLEYLPNAPRALKNRTRVRFHTGTCEILARVTILDRETIGPGEEAYAQIRLEAPTVVVHGDPFVIRSYSPIQTIGGGIVLDGLPKKHRRRAPQVLETLQSMHQGDPATVVIKMVEEAGAFGISRRQLDRRLNLPECEWQAIFKDPFFLDNVRAVDEASSARPGGEETLLVSRKVHEALSQEVVQQLKTFHGENPLEPGIPKDVLRGRCRVAPPARIFNDVLQDLRKRGEVVVEGDRWRYRAHRVGLAREQEAKSAELERTFREAGLQPPLLKSVGEQLGLSEKEGRDLAEHLVRQGHLVKVKDGLYFHSEEIQALQSRLVAFLREKGEMQPLDFKEMTKLSRKFMIPLLEYFDRIKVTMRVGDNRVLRGKIQDAGGSGQ